MMMDSSDPVETGIVQPNNLSVTSQVRGRIVHVLDDAAFVDIGAPYDALLPGPEYGDRYAERPPEVGETVEAVVQFHRPDAGMLRVSVRALEGRRTFAAFQLGDKVHGVAERQTSSGWLISLDGGRGWLPRHESVSRDFTLVPLIGQRAEFGVLGLSQLYGTLTLTRRPLDGISEALATVRTGEWHTVSVAGPTDAGLVVDWGPVRSVIRNKVLPRGPDDAIAWDITNMTSISVQVRSIDTERGTLGLSARHLERPDVSALEVGQTISGRVVATYDRGVLISDGTLAAYVPRSEFSWTRSTVAVIGDEVIAVVIAIDKLQRRVTASVRAATPDPWADLPRSIRPGETLRGTVVGITNFGAFVRLVGKFDGLLHASELNVVGPARSARSEIEKLLAEGEEVTVRVLDVDRDGRRITLSPVDPLPRRGVGST